MKNIILKKMFSIILILGTINTMAQVGIGTTDPDDSAMLDIQSTSKGVLIPRVTTSQRDLILGVEGLLVFDSSTKSFWYYNNGWVELAAGSGSSASDEIADADRDTKVEVENTTDEDVIRFTAAGTEYMQINSNGDIKLGGRGSSTIPDSDNESEQNYTKITADGSLCYVGNATRWEDLKVPVNAVEIKAKKKTDGTDIEPAEWAGFREGASLGLLWFKNEDDDEEDEQEVLFTVQMPHGWKEGTNIFPHVHWTSGKLDNRGYLENGNGAPGGDRVTWGLEYTWVSVGEVFPESDIFYGSDVVPPNGTSLELYEHVITPLGSGGINGSGKTLSSMLVCRLFRNSTASSDTYGGEAGLLEIDFHYQVDSDGSNQEYTKD
ncbi:hypothetical protein ACFQ5N_05450 [Lutibacter holmesii]|uniref:Uncharacterized protein n=1 Tax=Lutibacter holmesii TaxID=1137985 RepID=A0ABW3WLS8_9FLAO